MVPVETEIRGTAFSVIHEYDRCLDCHTSYEPFENKYKNILKEYTIYREKVGYLQPKEIKSIRENYNFNIRQFALVLGIDYKELARIELGVLQNAYQNELFKLASCPKTMSEIVKKKGPFIAINLEDVLTNQPKM